MHAVLPWRVQRVRYLKGMVLTNQIDVNITYLCKAGQSVHSLASGGASQAEAAWNMITACY